MKSDITPTEQVQKCWGDSAPTWVTDMARECEKSSQMKVAKSIGRSASLINQVLKNKYLGNLSDVQSRFERANKDQKIKCPILNQISGEKCLSQQAKPYDPSNHFAVRLFRACRRCPQNLKGKSDVK